jgi:hypothetical protein
MRGSTSVQLGRYPCLRRKAIVSRPKIVIDRALMVLERFDKVTG